MAVKVEMTGMPQMVAIFNGFGGVASVLVASAEFVKSPVHEVDVLATMFLSILIGGVTFTGSMIAFGKLQGLVTEKAVMFPLQHPLNALLILVSFGAGVLLGFILFVAIFTETVYSIANTPYGEGRFFCDVVA